MHVSVDMALQEFIVGGWDTPWALKRKAEMSFEDADQLGKYFPCTRHGRGHMGSIISI